MSNQLSSHTNYFLIIILVVFHSLGSTSLYLLRGILVGLLASLCEPACALAICWSFCHGGGEEEDDDEWGNTSFYIIFLPGIQGASRDCLLSYNIALLQLLLQTLHRPLRWSGGRGESEGEEKKGLPFEVQLMNYS